MEKREGRVVVPGDGVPLAGRYRLQDRIAVGGAGEVWRAVDAVLGRAVAVKLLRPEYAGNGEMLARFRAEARYAALVCHPGVVPVYDYGPVGPVGAPFLVMELVDGPSLADVAACGPLEPAWVLDVAGQVAAGLAAAHAQGLVHRDIKPANLLLAPGGTVKITDFGIASAAGSASLTLAGTLPGTPGYLAPERAAGAPATAAGDLYSLGVVAWECLAGAPPFTGTPLEIASPAPAESGVPAARMVIVDDAALAGQPAGPVLRQLRRAGLRPSVVRVPDGHLAPGTVISVRPAGQVLVGGTVTVTTAIAPPGHRRGRGNGEGDGNDG